MRQANNGSATRSSAWVINGNATDEEIAAVTTVLAALARPGVAGPPALPANGWATHWRLMNTGAMAGREALHN